MLQDIGVPEAEHGVAMRAHEFVATPVVFAVGMLAAVDFDDKPLFPAGEIGEVWSDRKLAGKMIAAQAFGASVRARAMLRPVLPPCLQIACAFRRAWLAAASRLVRRPSPSPSRLRARHLSPTPEGRGRAPSVRELAPFLSPVDGGEVSRACSARRRGGRPVIEADESTRGERHGTQKSVGAPPSALRFSTKALSSSRIAGSM